MAEFPLKKSEGSDHTARIDYLMVSKMKESVLFVELKTDEKSFKDSQIDFYETDTFRNWHRKFLGLKMKGFETKKECARILIENKIGKKAVDDFRIAIIVLKPEKNLEEGEESNRHYVSLKDLELISRYPLEWELFKKSLLTKLENKEQKICYDSRS
ncbi:MAG: hypothetical protein LH473_13085 [Chitinophagales bacterium]|nr:hypothetical protein [Chitinophagales bacterium]